jgi:hypothetical protein
MKFAFKELMKDKNVLYIVLVLAVANLFGFLMSKNLNAIVMLLLVGFVTSYFSRNMIVVLMVSMVVTNIISGTRSMILFREGMENKNKKKEGFEDGDDDEEEDKKDKKEKKDGMSNLSPASLDEEASSSKKRSNKPKVDYAGTLEAAYDNLDSLLSSDALKNMSSDTQRLAEKQKSLMGNIKKLEPMMQKATAMLDGLDMKGMQGMIQSLSKNMSSLEKKDE